MSIKIVHLIISLRTGGAERMLSHLASKKMEGFETVVITMKSDPGDQPLLNKLLQSGIPCHSLGMKNLFSSFSGIQRLIQRLKAETPHVLQTWLYKADLLGLIAGRICGVPLICWNIRRSFTGYSEHPLFNRIILRFCAWLSGMPSAIIINSKRGMDSHAQIGFHPRRWKIIPNGFPLDEIARAADQWKSTIRQELQIPEDALVIGHLGRYVPVKNHALFMQMGTSILKRHPNAHFILCGQGVNAHASELLSGVAPEFHGHFHLFGEIADTAKMMGAFDLFTLTSNGEGFPNVIGEAMSAGIPCISTDVGDVRDIIGESGQVVPVQDAGALADAVEKFIALPKEERARLGATARMIIHDKYRLNRSIEAYLALYRSLMESAPP